MRITIDRQHLDPVLRWHSGPSPIALRAADGQVVIESSTPSTWRRSALDADVAEPGEAVFQAARLAAQVKVGKSATVEVSTEKTLLTSTVGRSNAQVPILGALPAGFWRPSAPEPLGRVGRDELAHALRTTGVCRPRPGAARAEVLRGVHLVGESDSLVLTSTDTYRLTQLTLPVASCATFAASVPPEPLLALVPLLDAEVELIRAGNHIGLRDSRHVIVSLGIESPWPPTTRIVDAALDVDEGALVDVQALGDALLLASDSHHGQVEITFGHSELDVRSRVADDGTLDLSSTQVPADVDESLTGRVVTVSGSSLLEMIKMLRGSEARLCIGHEGLAARMVCLRESGWSPSYVATLATVVRGTPGAAASPGRSRRRATTTGSSAA